MGRLPIQIDPVQVEFMAGRGATTEEIAAKLGCSKDTLERRFAAALQKGRMDCTMSLRGKQYELAMDGNATMLVWLGKQLLGQMDKTDITSDGKPIKAYGLVDPEQM